MKDRRLDIEPMDSVIVIREDGRVELTLPQVGVGEEAPQSLVLASICCVTLADDALRAAAESHMRALGILDPAEGLQ